MVFTEWQEKQFLDQAAIAVYAQLIKVGFEKTGDLNEEQQLNMARAAFGIATPLVEARREAEKRAQEL